MRVVFTPNTHNDGDPVWNIWPEHELVIRKVRYDAFYGTHLHHFLRLWGVDRLIVCGTVANICVHYTAASAALRWYDVIIPKDATSALSPFDLESSPRQTAFLFAGRITESGTSRSSTPNPASTGVRSKRPSRRYQRARVREKGRV